MLLHCLALPHITSALVLLVLHVLHALPVLPSFSGVGNIYRAEILYKTGLHPEQPGYTVDRDTFEVGTVLYIWGKGRVVMVETVWW